MKRKYCGIVVAVVMACGGSLAAAGKDESSPTVSETQGSIDYCSAKLEAGLLTLENSRISRVYSWNNGNIATKTLTDKISGKTWRLLGKKPDISFPGQPTASKDGAFSAKIVQATAVKPAHLEATITCSLAALEVKRVFRIYPACPAIACEVYLRGSATRAWIQAPANPADLKNIENQNEISSTQVAPSIERIELSGKHWRVRAFEFHDVTDRNNNLVYELDALLYRSDIAFRGNLLFVNDQISDNGFFILKEAPTSSVQIAYPGADFLANAGDAKGDGCVRLIGVGMAHDDLDPLEWKRAYGFTTGVYHGGRLEQVIALRDYQQRIRLHRADRDEMVLMNTWGDRAQDKKVNEKFCLAELDAGTRLGITHFQLDDGWQTGRSGNSAFAGGSFKGIWSNPDYWQPNPERFPEGLAALVEKGKTLGIKICLWFNPDHEDGNQNWEKDADALISLYRQYGILTFKIDGVKLPTKKAEINFRKMLDKVLAASNGEVVFNLDVTADRRGGYHSFNEYGNVFLENRYTDWQNYYPYWTLRNLWQLSSVVPPQNLQIEFLNKWRNTEKYGEDPFAPKNYSFDYLFAISMAAQPLAWFEGSGLPEDALTSIGPVIHKYREIQHDFHSGKIFPIGDEPSGRSWTGFQSIKDKSGYFLLFREANPVARKAVNTCLKPGDKVKVSALIGTGSSFAGEVDQDGRLVFELPDVNSFALYSYSLDVPIGDGRR